MAYYGDRVGGHPLGPDLVEDALGGIGGGGYGAPSFEYERRGRPLGGEYLGGPPEYFGAERPGLGRGGYGMEGLGMEGYERGGLGRVGYGMEGLGRERYGREGFGREGYAPDLYDDGYPSRRPMMPPPLDYLGGEPSDLGMGLRDAGKAEYMRPGYDMRSELGGYGGLPGYGAAESGFGGAERGYGGAEGEVRRLRKELEHERRQKHELELATGAAVGYGLHERHEKEEAEDEDDDDSDDGEKKGKKHHRLLQKLGL
jgi:hypothetical protein